MGCPGFREPDHPYRAFSSFASATKAHTPSTYRHSPRQTLPKLYLCQRLGTAEEIGNAEERNKDYCMIGSARATALYSYLPYVL